MSLPTFGFGYSYDGREYVFHVQAPSRAAAEAILAQKPACLGELKKEELRSTDAIRSPEAAH